MEQVSEKFFNTGSYSVGACAKDETTNMSNDSGYETITMAETTSG